MVGEVIPFYALRVRDMDHGNVELIGRCYGCDRRGIVDMKDVLRVLNPADFAQKIEPKLRCWRCRSRGHLIRRTLGVGDPFYQKPPKEPA